MSVIPTHLNEKRDGFLWTVTHWCTKEDTFSMHGPQGRVKQENGNDFKRLSQQEWGINHSCCKGLGFVPLWTRVLVEKYSRWCLKQLVMSEKCAQVGPFSAFPRKPSAWLRSSALLRNIDAHPGPTLLGGRLKQHMVFEAHTHTHTHSFIDKVPQDRTKPGLLPLLIDRDVFLEARLPAAHSHGFKPSMVWRTNHVGMRNVAHSTQKTQTKHPQRAPDDSRLTEIHLMVYRKWVYVRQAAR